MSVSTLSKTVRDALRDEESRVIYEHLAARVLDNSTEHIWDMLMDLHEYDMQKPLPKDKRPSMFYAPRGPAVFYGVGGNALSIRAFAETLGIVPVVYCDSDPQKWNTVNDGVFVISPDELLTSWPTHPIIVTSPIYEDEITRKLIQMEIEPSRIYSSTYSEKQYFGLPFLRAGKDEIYLDAGAYDGQNIVEFAEFCGGVYDKIYALEPEPENCQRTRARITAHGLQNVSIIEKGAWRNDEILRFSSAGSGSRLMDSGEVEMPVTSIDSVIGNGGVTFIKMDIEGAEMEALKGARDSIVRYKPKLAICVYHKPEDILEIPEFLLELNPEYGLYLRHHTLSTHETVLYAV